jgi:hypothetical protein
MPDKIKDFFKAEIAPTGLFKSEDEFRTYISDPKNASSFYESEVKPVGLFKDAEEFNSFLGLKKNDGLVSPTQNQQEVLPSNLAPTQSSVQNPRIEPSQEEDLSLLSVDELSKRYNKSKETINAYKEQVDKFKQEGEKGQVRLSGVANLYNYENNNLKNIADAYNQKIQQKAPKTPEPAPQAPTLLAKVREYQKIANAPVTKDYELNSMGDLDEVDNPASLKSKENAKVEYDKLIKEYATTTGISEDDLKQTLNDFPKISEDQKLVDYTKQRLENPAAYKRQKAASSWSNGLNDALVDYNQKAIAENKKPPIGNPVRFANQKREDLKVILKGANPYSQFINFTENLRKEISYLPNEVVNGIMKNVAIEGQGILEGAPDKDQYISSDPKSKNLNKYQVSWLNSIKISDPDLYKNRTRLLSVPMSKLEEQSSAKNEFSSLSPTSAIGASKAASAARNQRLASERVQLEAEEGGISMAKEDKTEKLDDLIRKSKTTGITQQEKEVADQLIVDLNQLDKDSKALNEKYPLATKDRDDQLLFSATGGELNRAERFAAKTVKGFDNALGFISDIISTPFMSKEQRVIQDLDELGGKRRFETKTARKQDDIVVGNYTINATPEFLKYIEEVDNDKSLTFEQKQQKKRDKYREDPYLITIKRNDNAGDLLFTSETVLNAVEDFGSQILPQLGLSAITGGGAAISKLRSLSTLFGTTFASGYKDNYLSAVEEGDAAPSTTAFRNTSIDALYELIGDDLAMVKKVFGKASGSIGKLVNSIDEAEWNKILSKKTGAFRAVKNVAKSFGKDVLLEGAKEATGEAAAAGTTSYLDNKEAYEPMKTAFVNTFVGSVATMGLGTVFNYKNITRAEKYAMYAAGANSSAYLADIDESLKNGTITEDEANKRRQVIQSMSNIVNEMPKVDGMSDNEVVDFAFNKYIQEQAGKAEKVIPDNAKVKELVQNLNNENNNIINAATESTQQAGSTESNIGQPTGTLQGQQEVGEGQQGEATQQGANVSDSNIVSEGELTPEQKKERIKSKFDFVSENDFVPEAFTKEEDAQYRDSLAPSRFKTEKELTDFLENNEYAMLTGQNPDVVSLSKGANAQLNDKAKQWLADRGLTAEPIFGRYDGSERSFLVPNMTKEQALEFSNDFLQQSVAHSEGLVYKDGTIRKRVEGYSLEPRFDADGNNYSTLKIGDKKVDFSINYDWVSPVSKMEAPKPLPAKNQKSTEIATELSRELTGPSDMIESVSQSLKATGINTVQLSGEEFAARAAKDGAQADSMGYFDDQAKEFVLNKDKADKATVIHEGAHPVMNIIYNTNRPLYDKVVSGMKQAAAKNAGVQSAIEFGGQYEMQEGETKEQAQARMDNEALVETLAKIEDGEIDLDELPKSFKQSLIDMVNSVAKFFGFDQVLDDTDVAAFKKLVGQVYDALTTGEDISSIVGVENVTKFENKIGEGVQERSSFVNTDKLNLSTDKRGNVKIELKKVQPTSELMSEYNNARNEAFKISDRAEEQYDKGNDKEGDALMIEYKKARKDAERLIKGTTASTSSSIELQDVLPKEFIDKYPSLSDIKIKSSDVSFGNRGNYNKETNTINVITKGENFEHTLSHEIGHLLWDKILTDNQKKLFSDNNPVTEHGKKVLDNKETNYQESYGGKNIHNEEDFAELFADNNGSLDDAIKAKKNQSATSKKVQERKTELPEKQARQMTEDGKGNYVFYHYSGKNINTIDPNKFGSNLATGRDEKPGVGISMYYTKKDTSEPGVPSNFGYVVRVPKDKVYSFNDDPLNLLPAAEKLFKKQYPNQAFDPNKQIGFLTKVANSKGYKMTVANWNIKGSFALRAQTTEALKPEKYTRIKPGTLNQTEVLSPELDKLKPNSKKRVQQRVDTLSDVERKQKQLEIINKENPAPNDYNTWIRKVEDIKTAEEAFKSSEKEGAMYPDFTEKDMKDALSSGEVTVYSSQPIKEGVFVSPSKINAQEYAGGKTGKLYSEKVKLEDVAWIDEGEGQFASTKAIEGLLGKPKKVQQRKSAVEKTKEFKLAAFVIRKKSEGASVLELATGIASVMPGMSPVEINNLINDPQQYIRDKFSYLSSLLQENLIARAGGQNIYANIPTKKSGAFSALSVDISSIENYLSSKKKGRIDKAVKFLGDVKTQWFSAAKGAPNWVLALRDISSGTRNLEIDVAVNTTKKLKKTANSIKFNDWDAFTKAIKSLSVNATPQQNSLQVVPPEILALPQEIQPFVYEMRDQIDGLTKDLVASGYVTPDQAVALESNIGQYVNRAYRLFNEKGYKPSKEDIANAMKYYSDIYIDELANKNAGVLTYDQVKQKAIEMADMEVKDILNKKVTPYFKSGDSRNVDILKKKEDIPEPIRKLMGEYTDPGTVFVMTVAKQAALRSASQLLTGLRDRGMGSVFFEENDPERPDTHSERIVAEGTETKNPLGGLYTTPEMAAQLQGIAKTTNQVLDVWMKLVGTVRWGKTVGSVVTQVKNFESNVGFAVMNGLIFTGKSGQGLKGAASYYGGRISGRELDELTAKVVSLGLVGQGVNAMELKKMLGSGDVHDIAVDLAVNGRSNYAKARNFVSAPIRAANKFYQLSDDFWKVYAYMNERHLIAKAMFGKSYDKLTEDQQVDVDIESSERVKSTWPTYDRVWEGAKYLSERVPLIGNFISFQAESVRVLSNTVKIALKDIKSGDPGFQALGYRRLFGIASYLSIRAGLTYAAATSAGMAVAGLLGIITGDDEEKEKLKGIKDALPQFMKTGDLLVIKGDKPGVFTVYNMSSIDPYNVMFNTMNALTEGREGMDAGPAAAVTEFFNGFMEPEMTYETVSSLLSNRSLKTGDKIYLDADNPGDKILKGAKYVWDNLEPSSVSLVNRLMEKENKGAEVSAVFGARPYDVDLNRSFRILLSTTTQDLETINKQYGAIKKSETATAEEKKAAEKEAEEKIAYYSERIGNTYKRFLLLGASKEELDNIVKEKRAVKSTGWSKQLKKSIISGKINKDDFLK